MHEPVRRARRPDSLGSAAAELVELYGVPLQTHAVRILLTGRGIPVTAENLGTLARNERRDAQRTRLAPRLCSAIDSSGEALVPRWWARGDWRLLRRIATDDAKSLWLGKLAERLCGDLASTTAAVDDQVSTLALGTVAHLLPMRYFDVPQSGDDWIAIRKLVVDAYPGIVGAHDVATPEQYQAESDLKATDLTPLELYFGRGRG